MCEILPYLITIFLQENTGIEEFPTRIIPKCVQTLEFASELYCVENLCK